MAHIAEAPEQARSRHGWTGCAVPRSSACCRRTAIRSATGTRRQRSAEPALNTATAMLDAYAADAWPEVDAESRSLAVETIVRLTVSHIVQPVASPEESARRIGSWTTASRCPWPPSSSTSHSGGGGDGRRAAISARCCAIGTATLCLSAGQSRGAVGI
ncbi:hypothetical protein [Streptomyces sp. NPDC050255]|uniref:hypothetical protein n=1 Tax=Streptomyces sp. NPDC050255 TaxID=3365606 RepID=UPI0037B52D22